MAMVNMISRVIVEVLGWQSSEMLRTTFRRFITFKVGWLTAVHHRFDDKLGVWSKPLLSI